VAQCVELDVASQGETESEALSNLEEALELYFEPPQATRPPQVRLIEVQDARLKLELFPDVKRRSQAAGFAETIPKVQPREVCPAIGARRGYCDCARET
jgi:hypothetical protein